MNPNDLAIFNRHDGGLHGVARDVEEVVTLLQVCKHEYLFLISDFNCMLVMFTSLLALKIIIYVFVFIFFCLMCLLACQSWNLLNRTQKIII